MDNWSKENIYYMEYCLAYLIYVYVLYRQIIIVCGWLKLEFIWYKWFNLIMGFSFDVA